MVSRRRGAVPGRSGTAVAVERDDHSLFGVGTHGRRLGDVKRGERLERHEERDKAQCDRARRRPQAPETVVTFEVHRHAAPGFDRSAKSL